MKCLVVALFLTLVAVPSMFAAEVKNDTVRQEGSRLVVSYDLEGTETLAKVVVTITVAGKTYGVDELHLEGDVGMVRPGKGKKIWWNVLQDFSHGLTEDVEVNVFAGGGDFRDPVTGMDFVWVSGGCYQMGCGPWQSECDDDEKPVHEVCVDGFWMGKTEVTQQQWEEIMDDNPSRNASLFKNTDNFPVERVSWNNTQDFIKKLSRQSGKSYRLPTEAEWEYAARSGAREEKYAGGSDFDAVAWHNGNSGKSTHPVAQKNPNGLGLYDMSGNVWEWCQDRYDEKYYGNSPRSNPLGSSTCPFRVIRGGSWYHDPKSVRSTNRGGRDSGDSGDYIGFRLVLPAVQ